MKEKIVKGLEADLISKLKFFIFVFLRCRGCAEIDCHKKIVAGSDTYYCLIKDQMAIANQEGGCEGAQRTNAILHKFIRARRKRAITEKQCNVLVSRNTTQTQPGNGMEENEKLQQQWELEEECHKAKA